MQWAQYWAKHLTTEFRHSVWSDNTAYAKLVGISADDIDSGENIGTTNFSDPVTCMDVISKKQFDEFSLPYIKKLIDGTEKIMGSRPGAHICGKTSPIWSDLADAGLFSFSIDNCEDLEVAKREVGDRMRFAGNVPPIEVMKDGSIDDVIEACKDCLRKCGDNPKGYILNTGCQLPIGTPKRNVEAFIYAARKYGRGAQLGKLPRGILED